jgi:hypothetical protein
MTRLFAEVYLDEDDSVLVAALFSARSFKAIFTRDAGLYVQSDIAQLEFAQGITCCF